MKSPGLKSIGMRPRDERGPILMAIALGLGGGLLLAAPLNQLLNGPPLGSNHQVVNPFSSWTGMGEKEVVILGTDVGGGNTDVMYTLRVVNGVTKLTQVPRDTYIDSSRFGPLKANALYAFGGPDAVILRPGMITAGELELALRGSGVVVRTATATVSHDAPHASAVAQRSPGMADRHYAPRADVWLFDAAQQPEIDAALAERGDHAGTVTALLRTTTLSLPDRASVRMPDDPASYARALYAALHAADAGGAALIVIERPPADDQWAGLRDRLTRAAR